MGSGFLATREPAIGSVPRDVPALKAWSPSPGKKHEPEIEEIEEVVRYANERCKRFSLNGALSGSVRAMHFPIQPLFQGVHPYDKSRNVPSEGKEKPANASTSNTQLGHSPEGFLLQESVGLVKIGPGCSIFAPAQSPLPRPSGPSSPNYVGKRAPSCGLGWGSTLSIVGVAAYRP